MSEPPEKKEEEAQESGTSWWGGWYDAAKKKLAETNEFMQRDISEFTQVVQEDTSRLVSQTANSVKEKLNLNVDLEEASTATKAVTESISNLFGTIQKTIGPIRPGKDEDADSSAVVGTATGVQVLSPADARLLALRSDPGTFCNEPDGEIEFEEWTNSFSLEERKGEVSTLMLDCPQIRALYTKLVPNAVSHFEFWTRYFYKLHQHEMNEIRRAKLMERAEKRADEQISWDDDDDDWIRPEKEENKQTTVEAMKSESPTNADNIIDDKPVETIKDKTQVQKSEEKSDAETAPIQITSEQNENIDNPLDEEKGNKQIEAANDKLTDDNKSEETVVEKSQHDEKLKHEEKSNLNTAANEKSSSEVSSDDWEKEFDLDPVEAQKYDLDMTEEEINDALQGATLKDAEDDWENWE